MPETGAPRTGAPETAADRARARRAARDARAARAEARAAGARAAGARAAATSTAASASAGRRPPGRLRSDPRPPGPPARRPDVPKGVFRRRRLVAALAVLAVLLVLWIGGTVLVRSSGIADVTAVTVAGNATVPTSEILAAAGVTVGGPLTDVDTATAADRVAALEPVASAQVSRSWPHTVAITIVERAPVATFTTAAGPQLVDGTGAVFAGAVPAGLPSLDLPVAGPGEPLTTAALAALRELPGTVRLQVVNVSATIAVPGAPPQITFGLTDDRRVRWGASDRGADKAAVLVPLLTQPGHVFDVASPELPTIRR